MLPSITQRIANELAVKHEQVTAAVALLDDGATVPFIARYRKEVTGALDDTQMRTLEERLAYLRELEARRETILASIDEQGVLSDELRTAIEDAETRSRLEDLYLPYKPKRRTKAQIAREAGLEPLAKTLLEDPSHTPETLAAEFLNPDADVPDAKSALDGARQILMEHFAEQADLLARLRSFLQENALLCAQVIAGQEQDASKFKDYFEHSEPLQTTPSHRALAMFRGRNEGVLTLALKMHADEAATDSHPCEAMMAGYFQLGEADAQPANRWLHDTVRWTWRVKLLSQLQTDLLGELRERAEREAIDVFAHNLKDLLLAAPAGARPTLGLDPGLRTGVKVAVIDATGKVVDHGAIFPNPPQKKVQEAEAVLLKLIRQHNVELIAVGNGTASRETDRFVGELLAAHADLNHVNKVMVNEAGASIYSASAFAAQEFPDLDVTIRGAISIARRLQDPLAELVKIEPKSIGVGQYQHDVNQSLLARQLDTVVEDCVNAVGVDVNTASAPLLARVSGLNTTIAGNIVSLREQQGRFSNRNALTKVSRFGPKTFEQAAGFLRIHDGDHPLDASAVHPERYALVEQIATKNGRQVATLVNDSAFVRQLKPADYVDETAGLVTVKDVLEELERPGRDPRPAFQVAKLREGVETIKDLELDMVLEGTITNVTNFGAFVDIGVHQDGLVHISALSDKFVKDPRTVVKAGDIVKVKVMSVDIARKRVGLSMRLSDSAADQAADNKPARREPRREKRSNKADKPPSGNNAFAQAFQAAKQSDKRRR